MLVEGMPRRTCALLSELFGPVLPEHEFSPLSLGTCGETGFQMFVNGMPRRTHLWTNFLGSSVQGPTVYMFFTKFFPGEVLYARPENVRQLNQSG